MLMSGVAGAYGPWEAAEVCVDAGDFDDLIATFEENLERAVETRAAHPLLLDDLRAHLEELKRLRGVRGGVDYGEQRWSGYRIEVASPLPEGLALAAVSPVVVDGSIYLFGGMAGTEPYSDVIYRYDTVQDRWFDTGNRLPYGMFDYSNNAAVLGTSSIMITPGRGPRSHNGWGQHRHIMEYDLSASVVSNTASFSRNI